MIDFQKQKISLEWTIEDVKYYASNDFQITLTDDQAMEILSDVYYSHDCNDGVKWSTFDYYILKHQNIKKSKSKL